MSKLTPTTASCPLARSFDAVGDWWSLLILRNALFGGDRRFDEFHRHLGIATNVLTGRLSDLVEAGVLTRVQSDHPRSRHEYRVTSKGADLWPVLAAFLEWGNRWVSSSEVPPLALVHRACDTRIRGTVVCPTCGVELTADDLRLEPAGPTTS